jgi:hypothetical protein
MNILWNRNEIISNSNTRYVDHSGLRPSHPCALASAQLVRVLRRLIELSVWMGCSQYSPSAVQTAFQNSHFFLPLLTFQTLAFWQPFLSCRFQIHICECFSSCNFPINLKKNSVKHLQDISIWQWTLTENTEFKNLGHAIPESCYSTLKRAKAVEEVQNHTIVLLLQPFQVWPYSPSSFPQSYGHSTKLTPSTMASTISHSKHSPSGFNPQTFIQTKFSSR